MAKLGTERDNYIFKYFDRIIVVDKTTRNMLAVIDELKDATIDFSAESSTMSGKNNVPLTQFYHSKATKISGNNAYIVGGLLATQLGSVPETSETPAFLTEKYEIHKVANGAASVTTDFAAVGVAGDEIGAIYKAILDVSPNPSRTYMQAAVASDTEFAYDPETRVLTLPTGVFAGGDRVFFIYKHMVAGKRIINSGSKFPKSVALYGDVVLADLCDDSIETHAYFIAENAKPDANFSIALGNNPAPHSFSFTLMKDACHTEDNLVEFIIPDDAEDSLVGSAMVDISTVN